MHTNCSLVTVNDLGTIENKSELCLIPLNTLIKKKHIEMQILRNYEEQHKDIIRILPHAKRTYTS